MNKGFRVEYFDVLALGGLIAAIVLYRRRTRDSRVTTMTVNPQQSRRILIESSLLWADPATPLHKVRPGVFGIFTAARSNDVAVDVIDVEDDVDLDAGALTAWLQAEQAADDDHDDHSVDDDVTEAVVDDLDADLDGDEDGDTSDGLDDTADSAASDDGFGRGGLPDIFVSEIHDRRTALTAQPLLLLANDAELIELAVRAWGTSVVADPTSSPIREVLHPAADGGEIPFGDRGPKAHPRVERIASMRDAASRTAYVIAAATSTR